VVNYGPPIGNNGLTRIFIPQTNQEAINWYGPYNGQGEGDPPPSREPIADTQPSAPQETQGITDPSAPSVITQTLTHADEPMPFASQPDPSEAGKELLPNLSSPLS
jgi:hypothetical protein